MINDFPFSIGGEFLGKKNAVHFQGNLHPGRLTWNLLINHLERKMIWTKPPFLLSSMLIFQGVVSNPRRLVWMIRKSLPDSSSHQPIPSPWCPWRVTSRRAPKLKVTRNSSWKHGSYQRRRRPASQRSEDFMTFFLGGEGGGPPKKQRRSEGFGVMFFFVWRMWLFYSRNLGGS